MGGDSCVIGSGGWEEGDCCGKGKYCCLGEDGSEEGSHDDEVGEKSET